MLNFINQLFYLKLFLKCLNGFFITFKFCLLRLNILYNFLTERILLNFLKFLTLESNSLNLVIACKSPQQPASSRYPR